MRGVAARHLADVEVLASEYLGARGEIDQVSADELADRLTSGRVVVLDVRPAAEYEAGHIAGARNVPLDRLAEEAARLAKRADVIAYCRGPYCVYADDAVRHLRERGVRARRLDVGFPEWKRAGHPIEQAADST
jgi:rhodanese-related sulfurtransferase